MSTPPESPRRQSEISSYRGAEPKRKPKRKPKCAKSPDTTRPCFIKDEFSDVIVKVDDKELYCNRCLLCYMSPVFMKQLSDEAAGKGKAKPGGAKVLDLSGHKLEDVCDLISFIDPRTRKDLSDEEAMNLVLLAEEYDIAQLKKACGWTLTEAFKKKRGRRAGCVPTNETLRYLILADKNGLKEMQDMCMEELVASDNPSSSRAICDCEELSEHVKRQVLQKKLEKVSYALTRERRMRTEKDLDKDTRGSSIWKR